MKIRLNAVKSLIAITLLASSAFMIGAPTATAGNAAVINPAPLSDKVRHELVTLPWYGVFDNLQYQVNGSEVILGGQVISEHSQTKYDAANAVKRIPGVTKVVNNIDVLPPLPFDNQIRRAEYRAIFSQSTLGRYSLGSIPQIHIIVNGGHVTLEGIVINKMDRDIAGITANSVPGVFSVTNNLRLG